MRVSEAIVGRQSIRAFLSDRPVSNETIEALLNVAGRAPSGSNIQPWQVYVVRGERKSRITEACSARFLAGDEGGYEYYYYPREWRQPYIGRRRQTGFGLYGLLGVDRSDNASVQNYRVQNYQFFGAPVGLFCTVDDNMGPPQWSDLGMILQTIMLLLREQGLDSCAQESWSVYPKTISEFLGLPEHRKVFAGMAIGYANPDSPVNQLTSPRAPLSENVEFIS